MTERADFDREVRVAIARSIRERGAIPTMHDVARALGREAPDVDASFARMIEGHVFIPREGSHEIHAYDPFCTDPTAFRVSAGGRDWSAICGWDALGVPPALGASGTIDARCGDCDEPLHIVVGRDGSATAESGTLLQIGVPAREFWTNIRFT